MRRVTTLIIGLAGAATVAACGNGGGGGGGSPIDITSGNIAYFVVRARANADTVQVLPGGQAQLTGAAYDGNLNPIALVGDTAWISRDTTVATVDVHGLITAVAVGNTWVIGAFTPKTSSTAYPDSVYVQVFGTK